MACASPFDWNRGSGWFPREIALVSWSDADPTHRAILPRRLGARLNAHIDALAGICAVRTTGHEAERARRLARPHGARCRAQRVVDRARAEGSTKGRRPPRGHRAFRARACTPRHAPHDARPRRRTRPADRACSRRLDPVDRRHGADREPLAQRRVGARKRRGGARDPSPSLRPLGAAAARVAPGRRARGAAPEPRGRRGCDRLRIRRAAALDDRSPIDARARLPRRRHGDRRPRHGLPPRARGVSLGGTPARCDRRVGLRQERRQHRHRDRRPSVAAHARHLDPRHARGVQAGRRRRRRVPRALRAGEDRGLRLRDRGRGGLLCRGPRVHRGARRGPRDELARLHRLVHARDARRRDRDHLAGREPRDRERPRVPDRGRQRRA